MGARTIRSGIGTYQDVDGQWRHGVLGDEVDVHEDDLERFDRLNPPAPEDPEAETADESEEPTFSQEDVDAAVKAAVAEKDAELVAAKKALDAANEKLAASTAEGGKTETAKAATTKAPARATAKQS